MRFLDRLLGRTKETAGDVADKAQDVASDAVDKAKDVVGGGADEAQEKAEDVTGGDRPSGSAGSGPSAA
jgi:hypothetical protein